MSNCENAKNSRSLWEERFADTVRIPFSHTGRWVDLGVGIGLAPDTEQGRLNLAREMGAIMSFVSPSGQQERFREDLDITAIAGDLGQDANRVAGVVNCMVNGGAIVSRERRRQLGSTWARMAR